MVDYRAIFNSGRFTTQQAETLILLAKAIIAEPPVLTLGDIVAALGYTPINKAGDTGIGTLEFNNNQTLIRAAGNARLSTGPAGGTFTISAGGVSNSAFAVADSVGVFAAVIGMPGTLNSEFYGNLSVAGATTLNATLTLGGGVGEEGGELLIKGAPSASLDWIIDTIDYGFPQLRFTTGFGANHAFLDSGEVQFSHGLTLAGNLNSNALSYINWRTSTDSRLLVRDDGAGATSIDAVNNANTLFKSMGFRATSFNFGPNPVTMGGSLAVTGASTFNSLATFSQAGAATEAIRVANTTDSKRLHLAAGTAGAQVRSENSNLLLDAKDSGTGVVLSTQGTARVVVGATKIESSVELEIFKNVPAVSANAYNDGHIELLTTDLSKPRIGFHIVASEALALYYNGGSSLRVINNSGVDGLLWNSANDGSGSGLDADLLDGVQGENFVQGTTANRTTEYPGNNANNAAPSGFYEITPGGTNGPTAATWYWITNTRHSNTGNYYAFQTAQALGSNATYTRNINNGTPGAWQRFALFGDDVTFRDVTADRGDGTGVIFFTGSRYLYYDGTKYDLPGAPLHDIRGDVRDMPRVTGGLTAGCMYVVSAGFTINTGLAAGKTYGIYNDSGASITLTQGGGLTLRKSRTATTGNMTLEQRGFAFLWCNSTTEYIIDGVL